MNNANTLISDDVQERPAEKAPKSLTARLRLSKNFHKEDRSLDDYLDRTKLLNNGEKRTIRKMLKLRKREDDNTVKITYAGLTKLLGVDIKTVRRCVKSLVQKGFIIFEGDIQDPGCYYPKKLYSFPVTFPGFDLKTVFIKRGSKKRYNAAQQRRAGKARKSTSFLPKGTPPIASLLVDCSKQQVVGTMNSSEEPTNVGSSSEIQKSGPGSTASPQSRVFPIKKPRSVPHFHHKVLHSLILDFIRSHKVKVPMLYLSRYFNKICDTCRQYQTIADREELADDMCDSFPQFAISTMSKRNLVAKLFDWIKESVHAFCPTRHFTGPEYQRLIADLAKYLPEDMPVCFQKNRMPYVDEIPDKATRIGMVASLLGRDRWTDENGITYVYPKLSRSSINEINTEALAKKFLSPFISKVGWSENKAPQGAASALAC